MTSLLEIKNIRVFYGKVQAVKGISIDVPEGSIATLIGANGAGKSTTLRTISGLKSPSTGEISFKGKQIAGLQPKEIVKLGIAQCPEGRRVFPFMTVMENLKSGAYLRKDKGDTEKDLGEIFDRFPRLRERRRQLAGTLSGGEQQMLAIGRALMAKPTLLLLDEPSLGLAPLVVKEIAKIIKDINHRGVSIILVEQNANLALRLANIGYVLETGYIALHGDAKELLTNDHVKRAYLGS